MEATINFKHIQKLEALTIAKRLVDQGVTNDLDTLASVTNLCKEEIVQYISKNRVGGASPRRPLTPPYVPFGIRRFESL